MQSVIQFLNQSIINSFIQPVIHSVTPFLSHSRTQPFFQSMSHKSVNQSASLLINHRSDEGLTLETSAFKLFTVANLRFQLSI